MPANLADLHAAVIIIWGLTWIPSLFWFDVGLILASNRLNRESYTWHTAVGDTQLSQHILRSTTSTDLSHTSYWSSWYLQVVCNFADNVCICDLCRSGWSRRMTGRAERRWPSATSHPGVSGCWNVKRATPERRQCSYNVRLFCSSSQYP